MAARTWKTNEARELAESGGVTCPVSAMRIHTRALLAEASAAQLPTRLDVLMGVLGVTRIRERKMTLEAGLVRSSEEKFEVLVRRDRPSTRKRFSIAHEFGHLLFYRYAPRAKREQSDRGVQAPMEEERLCNVAAAELLMPQTFVEKAIARETDNLAATVLEVARVCETSVASSVIRLAPEWKRPGALQLWRRDVTRGWELQLSRRTGGTRVKLDDFMIDDWKHRIADKAWRVGEFSGRQHIFSSNGCWPNVRSRVLRCRSAKTPMLVLHHGLAKPHADANDVQESLATLHAQRRSQAMQTPADPSCRSCHGTGYEYLEHERTVRMCVCRYGAIANRPDLARPGPRRVEPPLGGAPSLESLLQLAGLAG